MTEREKMLSGALYLASDPELVRLRLACRELLSRFNHAPPAAEEERQALLRQLFERFGPQSVIEPPFRCDYGHNISIGARFYANFDCVILDPARVEIGDDVFFGPSVHLYTATHPLDSRERIKGPELGRPIRIGHRVWVGGGSILLPGITVGEGSTVGAGSVVTKDVPPNTVVAGNPARLVRTLESDVQRPAP